MLENRQHDDDTDTQGPEALQSNDPIDNIQIARLSGKPDDVIQKMIDDLSPEEREAYNSRMIEAKRRRVARQTIDEDDVFDIE